MPRRAAPLAVVAALLVPGAARADGPAPTPPPAGYAPPPLVYAPYPAGFVFAQPPFTPMKRKSPARMGAGIALITIGATAVLAGTTLAIAGAPSSGYTVFSPCGDINPCQESPSAQPGVIAAGIVTLVLGSASIATGVPLLVSGMRKVPDTADTARLVPEIGVGARSGSLTWRF
jgi:hypothetical protein